MLRLGGVQVFHQKCEIFLRGKARRAVALRALPEAQNVDDTLDKYRSLTAARACKNQQRPFGLQSSLTLHVVQIRKTLLYDRASDRSVLYVEFGQFHGKISSSARLIHVMIIP